MNMLSPNLKKSYILAETIIAILSILCFCGCSVSVTLADTHGTAEDVVDSTPTNTTKTDAALTIPAIP